MNKKEFIISYRKDDKIFEKHITEEDNDNIDKTQNFLEKIKFILWRIIEIDLNYKDLFNFIQNCEKESKKMDYILKNCK